MTTDNIIPMPQIEKIEEEATIWAMRFVEGNVSDEDRSEFKSWISQGAQHKDAFERMLRFGGGLENLKILNDFAESDVANESIRQENRASFIRKIWPAIGGALAASVLGSVWLDSSQIKSSDAVYFESSYHTIAGEQTNVSLPDGSEIILNTDSSLEVVFSKKERYIALSKGEAHFSVFPDAEAPFSVQTDRGRVTALGTAFSVRLGEEKLNLLVTEGRVSLQALAARAGSGVNEVTASDVDSKDSIMVTEVSAGQVAIVGDGLEDIDVFSPEMIEKATDWQDGELSFNGETLEEVVSTVERYSGYSIEIADDQLREQKVVAYFKVGETEQLIDALRIMARVEVERISETKIRLSRSSL